MGLEKNCQYFFCIARRAKHDTKAFLGGMSHNNVITSAGCKPTVWSDGVSLSGLFTGTGAYINRFLHMYSYMRLVSGRYL